MLKIKDGVTKIKGECPEAVLEELSRLGRSIFCYLLDEGIGEWESADMMHIAISAGVAAIMEVPKVEKPEPKHYDSFDEFADAVEKALSNVMDAEKKQTEALKNWANGKGDNADGRAE